MRVARHPFWTAVPFWGQSTWDLSGLSPKWDCSPNLAVPLSAWPNVICAVKISRPELIPLKCGCRSHAMPNVVLLDMTGTTYTFYEKESKNREIKHTRDYANFRWFQREGVEQRPKDKYALFQLIIQQTRPSTKNGYEYTHLRNKHTNPFRWPCNNNIIIIQA